VTGRSTDFLAPARSGTGTVFSVSAEDHGGEDLEVRLHWPTSHVGTLLPARQTQLSDRQLRPPRAQRPVRRTRPTREVAPVARRRQGQVQRTPSTAPAVFELAERVQELTDVVNDLGARMAAQVAELKQGGGAFTELRESTEELRLVRDAIESLVATRNERQAGVETQLERLTKEIRLLRRQVPMATRPAAEQALAETIGDAVRSAFVSQGNGNGRNGGNGRSVTGRRR